MALLLLLKKNSDGGISSGAIGVRSYTKLILKLGFPKVDCNSVNEVIGAPISLDDCFSVELDTKVVGIEGDVSCPHFKKASRCDFS
jgi:hypothetical protein